MEISIKHECKYEYKIYLEVCESDFMKITKVLKNITFQLFEDQLLGNRHYLVELNITQLTDILNYLLEKLEKIEWLEKTLAKYDNN